MDNKSLGYKDKETDSITSTDVILNLSEKLLCLKNTNINISHL
jgi:hypothetical protein